MSSGSRPTLPPAPLDRGERIKRSLPPELSQELEAIGIDPVVPPTTEQWYELLPRVAGLLRARSFGRDGVALSHELRTPMTVVIGASELLLETSLDATQRAAVQGVHSSGRELLSILNQVLDHPRDSAHPISSAYPDSGRPSGSVRPGSVRPDSAHPNARLDGRALVVEDNQFNQALITHALSGIGCQVESVGNGMDALQRISSGDYDVILMDCHMAGLDGFDTTREIRRLERGRSHVPIIAVTAGGVPEMRRTCLAAGMDDYVAKPFSLATLRARVAYWVARGRDAARVPVEAPPTVPVTGEEEAVHLDLSRLRELAQDDDSAAIAVDLTKIFLDDVVRRIRTFAEAAANRDQGQCAFQAHAIKGACGNFGATGMARLAEEAERCCKIGAFDQIGALSVRLSEELALVRAILDQYGLVSAPGVPAYPRLGK